MNFLLLFSPAPTPSPLYKAIQLSVLYCWLQFSLYYFLDYSVNLTSLNIFPLSPIYFMLHCYIHWLRHSMLKTFNLLLENKFHTLWPAIQTSVKLGSLV